MTTSPLYVYRSTKRRYFEIKSHIILRRNAKPPVLHDRCAQSICLPIITLISQEWFLERAQGGGVYLVYSASRILVRDSPSLTEPFIAPWSTMVPYRVRERQNTALSIASCCLDQIGTEVGPKIPRESGIHGEFHKAIDLNHSSLISRWIHAHSVMPSSQSRIRARKLVERNYSNQTCCMSESNENHYLSRSSSMATQNKNQRRRQAIWTGYTPRHHEWIASGVPRRNEARH